MNNEIYSCFNCTPVVPVIPASDYINDPEYYVSWIDSMGVSYRERKKLCHACGKPLGLCMAAVSNVEVEPVIS